MLPVKLNNLKTDVKSSVGNSSASAHVVKPGKNKSSISPEPRVQCGGLGKIDNLLKTISPEIARPQEVRVFSPARLEVYDIDEVHGPDVKEGKLSSNIKNRQAVPVVIEDKVLIRKIIGGNGGGILYNFAPVSHEFSKLVKEERNKKMKGTSWKLAEQIVSEVRKNVTQSRWLKFSRLSDGTKMPKPEEVYEIIKETIEARDTSSIDLNMTPALFKGDYRDENPESQYGLELFVKTALADLLFLHGNELGGKSVNLNQPGSSAKEMKNICDYVFLNKNPVSHIVELNFSESTFDSMKLYCFLNNLSRYKSLKVLNMTFLKFGRYDILWRNNFEVNPEMRNRIATAFHALKKSLPELTILQNQFYFDETPG
ncbi:hypothetical protein [Paraburkholderia hayleyella]|uniref:hypothetical protein n=1 Tax=Paraburkholderia hayleyella TaxID=2152889 RepID=UPI0012919A4A|nr:hypothetical protein [Paraburkholderia hayleyella]